MSISKDTVKYVANLARIALGEDEIKSLSSDLGSIIGFVDKIAKADIGDIPPTSHILPVKNVMREDENRSSLPIKEALSNAPEKEGNFFVVPKVIE